ncbi:Thioredoxin [Aquisphaera giovannonii]|uniref:Thioredoxin n=1 Tax=Aquisphaera giovannonii TaxID=406548 RepID=A0A5B9W9R0_9BACT|nr:thioredoxin domain-containing protein [Aquisphaera giovannonii]QEH37177.1 Thioredoxin [Aquisphaera giovannonii]
MSLAPLLVALAAATASAAPSSGPVLLDFHAEWCPPCRQMRPVVAQLVDKGYPIRSVDIDKHPELAEKYGVSAVPTFVVIDRAGNELGRSKGSQPASQLAQLYNQARAKAHPPAGPRAHAQEDEDGGDAEAEEGADDVPPARTNAALVANDEEPAEDPKARTESEEEAEVAAAFRNPRPWETVVRIRVESKGSIGFGSGTVIHSTADEAIILTCAHIFKLDGQRQASPDRFPRPISVDLFDGKLHGESPQTVHFVERVPGKAIDYDFDLDVGLIRIRPGRKLPASRVVPAHWKPQARFAMMSVGCSEGHDATPMPTMIINPKMRGLSGHQAYEAIECLKAPKQGRSGGGLYTTDGYLAGVCNFAEPRGDHGLYATPDSIYSILDRNRLTELYAPVGGRGDTLLASRGGQARPQARGGAAPITVARGQSPDGLEEHRVPDPEFLHIKVPATRQASGGKDGSTWRMARSPGNAARQQVAKLTTPEPIDGPRQTEINIDPSVGGGHIATEDPTDESGPGGQPARASKINTEDVPAAPVAARPSPAPAGNKSGWRPSRELEGSSASGPSNR